MCMKSNRSNFVRCHLNIVSGFCQTHCRQVPEISHHFCFHAHTIPPVPTCGSVWVLLFGFFLSRSTFTTFPLGRPPFKGSDPGVLIVCQSWLWADLGFPVVCVCVYVWLCVCIDRNRTIFNPVPIMWNRVNLTTGQTLLFHGLPTRILFIVWPQLWERSPDIAVVCMSVSVLCNSISRVILLLTLCACWALTDRPTSSLFILHYTPNLAKTISA